MSVAGLSTKNELEEALFLSSVRLPTQVMEIGRVVGRAAARFVNIDPADISLRHDLRSGSHVVVLDDIERFAGEFAELFGFALHLLDTVDLHLILIADEARAAERYPDYATYRERLIGSTVQISPKAVGLYREFSGGVADVRTRELLLSLSDDVEKAFLRSGVVNIRTIRAFVDTLSGLLFLLDKRHPPSRYAPLALAAMFWRLVEAENHLNTQLLIWLFSSDREDLAMSMAGLSDEPSPRREQVNALAERFGFDDMLLKWPLSTAFVSAMNSGDFVSESLEADFRLAAEDRVDPLSRPETHFELSDETLSDDVQSLFAELTTGRETSHFRLSRVLDHLMAIASSNVLDDDARQMAEKISSAFSRFPPERVVDLESDPFDVSTGTAERESARSALRDLIARCQQQRQTILVQEFHSYIYSGHGSLQGDVRNMPLFPEGSADSIFERLRGGGGSAAIKICRQISNRLHSSPVPPTWLSDVESGRLVVEEINREEQSLGVRKVSTAFAARRVLRDRLKTYVEWLDRSRVAE